MKLENGKNGTLSFGSKTEDGQDVEILSITATVTH
jgi:hypothetical protein